MQNLNYSATFLKASLTSKFRNEIEHANGIDASGPQVLLSIIERKLSLQVSLQRELITKLEKLKITDEPGENIPHFNTKVKDLCEAIEKCGPAPADLNLLVMTCFVNCSVTIFSQHVNTKFFKLKQDATAYPWCDTLQEHCSMFYQLRDMWTPEASRPVTNKEFQNFVKSTRTNMHKLQISGGQGGNGNSRNSSRRNTTNAKKDKKCWGCGKPNVVKGHDGYTKP